MLLLPPPYTIESPCGPSDMPSCAQACELTAGRARHENISYLLSTWIAFPQSRVRVPLTPESPMLALICLQMLKWACVSAGPCRHTLHLLRTRAVVEGVRINCVRFAWLALYDAIKLCDRSRRHTRLPRSWCYEFGLVRCKQFILSIRSAHVAYLEHVANNKGYEEQHAISCT